MRAIRTLGLAVLVVSGAYLASYFALVQRGWGDVNCGWASYYPIYRFSGPWPCGLAGRVYETAHQLDRRFLRTAVWSEKHDFVALIAADLVRDGQLRATNLSVPNQRLQATPR